MSEKKNVEMKQLQELLQSGELREKIRSASDESMAAKLVSEAAAKKGYKLSETWIHQAFDDVKIAREPAHLTEAELHKLASTMMSSDTPPMLCHTDSCGGRHPGCC